MRDTNEDWSDIGSNEPYYGVLTHPRFLRENLTEETLNEFWSSGEDQIAQDYDLIVKTFGDFTPKNAIDFGCGVGRLTRALAKISARATGVDISPGMLEEARRGAPANVRFLDTIPDEMFDYINSRIVFQHIPPERGYEAFDLLLDRLDTKGVISVHFTIFKSTQGTIEQGISGIDISSFDGHTLRTVIPNVLKPGTMMMYDYDLTRLVAMMAKRRLDDFRMLHVNHGGCHGVHIMARKSN